MSAQKFFSGLTDGMMNKNKKKVPDRQQTNFFWPDETDVSKTPQNHSKSPSKSSVSSTQASTDPEGIRRNQTQSNNVIFEVEKGDNKANIGAKAKNQDPFHFMNEFHDHFPMHKLPEEQVISIERPCEPSASVIVHKINFTS